jgi:hypothetical protein
LDIKRWFDQDLKRPLVISSTEPDLSRCGCRPSRCHDGAVDHKGVIDACNGLCALDMWQRNISAFASAGAALLLLKICFF